MTGESKMRKFVEKLKNCCLDVLGIGKTHMLGLGVWSENRNDECKLWEGMVWTGINENFQGRGKAQCAVLL